MTIVFLTALGVGGATILGGISGYFIKNVSQRFHDFLLSFAAGVMLCAAITGLILPAIDDSSLHILFALLGIFLGAVTLSAMDRYIPGLRFLIEQDGDEYIQNTNLDRALRFVAAMAIHNFPEGLAAGVGFGCEHLSDALLLAGGIALQNFPEGMVIIAPMLKAGISAPRALLCAVTTGLFEIIGTFVGFLIIRTAQWMLPFALGFAGGTMLYIISDEMIPETHSDGSNKKASFALIAGFCVMLLSDRFLG